MLPVRLVYNQPATSSLAAGLFACPQLVFSLPLIECDPFHFQDLAKGLCKCGIHTFHIPMSVLHKSTLTNTPSLHLSTWLTTKQCYSGPVFFFQTSMLPSQFLLPEPPSLGQPHTLSSESCLNPSSRRGEHPALSFTHLRQCDRTSPSLHPGSSSHWVLEWVTTRMESLERDRLALLKLAVPPL